MVDGKILASHSLQPPLGDGVVSYRSTSPTRKRPPPYDPPMTLGIGLHIYGTCRVLGGCVFVRYPCRGYSNKRSHTACRVILSS